MKQSTSVLPFLILLLLSTLACSLVAEGNLTDDQRLVRPERPALLMIAPEQGSRYLLGTEVIFHALVIDSVGVARVEFSLDIPGEALILTYTVDNPQPNVPVDAIVRYTPEFPQLYIVTVRAFREGGDVATQSDDIPSNEMVFTFEVVLDVEAAGLPPVSSVPSPTATLSTAEDNLPVFPSTLNSALPIPVRQGPSVSYAVVQNIEASITVNVVGRSEDSLWLVIQLPDGFGWILSSVVNFDGDVATLPPVAAPPLQE